MREKLTYLFVRQTLDNPTDPKDPRVEKQFLDYDANGNITHIERAINNPEQPMDESRELVRKFVWDEEDRLMGVDLRPESAVSQPHISAYTYDAGGERGIRYVPRQMEGEYSGRTAGYTQDMDIVLYPNALVTVRPQELPEDFDPMRMHPEHTFTIYSKHYYIGSERINSKLGTVKDLGILCEQIGGGYYLIDEMNTRVMNAGKRLELLYNDLDKDLRLKHPYLYSREHQIVCDFKSHDSELYDAYWYHPDHLGSSSYITNTTGEISQHMEYLPFGETLVEEHLNSYNSPFKFKLKEYDAETGNYYYGARYYDPKWSIFLTPDPSTEKYPSWTPYHYVHQNPIKYIDPDGRDAILVVFPSYMIDTETRVGKLPLGHAGILLIDNETGQTKYYEYGRYNTEDGTKGRVRNVTVSNVIIDSETGKPTQESLNKVLVQISKNSGQGGEIQGAYIEGDFNVMNDYAQGKLKESNPQYKEEYNKGRKPYKLLSNNCGTFAHDVIKQDSDAKKKAPWIFNPIPTNIADEYQDNFPKVNYNPNTRTTTSEIYKPKEE